MGPALFVVSARQLCAKPFGAKESGATVQTFATLDRRCADLSAADWPKT